ncbi:MAG: lactate racemase domain-containing protein, partial [Candidatus Bathyarchaeota archaeon]
YSSSIAAASIAWNLEQLEVRSDSIDLLVGNALRVASDSITMEVLQSTDTLKGVNILEHHRDSGGVTSLGSTTAGTELEVSNHFIDADLRIAIGEVTPDHFAGIRGAQSSVLPALASYRSLERHRELAFRGEVRPGEFKGNPAHEDQMEASEMVGVDMALQLVTDGHGNLLSAFSGQMDSSLKLAVEDLGDTFKARVEEEVDIVVVSAGGDRFDFDLYNAIWALDGIAPFIKRGGTILLLAECSEGLGAEGLDALARVETVAELRRRYMLGARAVHTIKSSVRSNEVVLVSALPKYQAESLGLTVMRAANEAFQKTLQRKRGRETLVVTHGCSVIPVSN